MYRYLIFVAVIFLFGCSLEKKMQMEEYQIVINRLGNSIHKNSQRQNLVVAEAYRKSNRIEKAVSYYKKAITQGNTDPEVKFHLAQALKAEKKYEEAAQLLASEVEKAKKDSTLAERYKQEITNLQQIKKLLKTTSYYKIKNLETLNTRFDEYSPVIFDEFLFFTSNRNIKKIYKTTGTPFSDIFFAKTIGANVDISSLKRLNSPINDPNINEGTPTFFPNRFAMVFAKGNTGKSSGATEVNLFFTRFRRKQWSAPIPIAVNNPKTWDSTPMLSPDGKILYFSSNRKGGYGGTDLYMATLNPRGQWIDVKNMGAGINTSGNEMFPFVGKTGVLYFASDGHPGYGKLDLFRVEYLAEDMQIINLGKPINSESDDFGLFEYDITKGFFCSNREGGKGNDDIYIYLNDDPDLKVVNYVLRGTTYTLDDGNNRIVLPNVKVSLLSKEESLFSKAFSSDQGLFNFKVYPENEYILLAEKPDYFTKRATFSTIKKSVDKTKLTEQVTTITFEIALELERIVIEKPVVVNNIYYDLDKAHIREDASVGLDMLVQIMEDNPEIYIELSAHTDSRASDDYNIDLSQRRSQAVVEYLTKNGIDSKRLVSKGYGKTQLLIPNAQTEEQHQVNRRTEFKILKYNPNRDDEIRSPNDLMGAEDEEKNQNDKKKNQNDKKTKETNEEKESKKSKTVDEYDRFFKHSIEKEDNN